MKPSILIVMLDFLVCSLLMFVIGKGGSETRSATSAAAPAVHEEFSPAAMATLQEEWNRDYEQQTLLAQLNTETAAKEQLRTQLAAKASEAQALQELATQREANLKTIAEQKSQVEQEKSQVQQTLATTATQLAQVSAEHGKLQQEKAQLQQQTQQLGETVSSQQLTIKTLAEEVRASQEKLETQFTGFAEGQQQLAASLQRVEELAQALPAAVQRDVSDVAVNQRAMQENLATLAENVRSLQTEMGAEERKNLMLAVADVAKGQLELQSRLDSLLKSGQGDQITQSLGTLQSGQDALREQTAKLANQVETIGARRPGPFRAVKGARLEMQVSILSQQDRATPPARFSATAYPPVVNAAGHSYIIANYQSVGLAWWGLTDAGSGAELSDLKCVISHRGETPATLTGTACALKTDSRVVAIELEPSLPGLTTLELAGTNAVMVAAEGKYHVFKSTAAGLSFEVDAAPDLADPRYLVLRRPLRGIAAWFENPAYRPAPGDFVVTAEGKLIGLMVSRESCFIITPAVLENCGASLPFSDKSEFLRAARQFRVSH